MKHGRTSIETFAWIAGGALLMCYLGLRLWTAEAHAAGIAQMRAEMIVAEANVASYRPADQSLWVDTGSQPRRIKTSRTGKDGSFKIGPLPAGEYYVVAIEDSAPRSWQDPAYLDAVSRSAQTVRIGEVQADGMFKELYGTPEPVKPDPYLNGYEWAEGLAE